MAVVDVSVTEMACAPKMQELDDWLRDLVPSRPDVSVDQDTLTITATVGGVQVVLTFDESVVLINATTSGPDIGVPARVTEGSDALVELQAATDGGMPEPLGSRFRLTIERNEGPSFLVIDSTEAAVPDGVEFWVDKSDGRTRLVTNCATRRDTGSRLTDAQAANGIDVVIEAVDAMSNAIAATAPAASLHEAPLRFT